MRSADSTGSLPSGTASGGARRVPWRTGLAVLICAAVAAWAAVAFGTSPGAHSTSGTGRLSKTTGSGGVRPGHPGNRAWRQLATLVPPPGTPEQADTIPALGSISCYSGSPAGCVAVGGPFVATGADVPGTPWRLRAAPTGTGYLSAISCADKALCVAVGEQAGPDDSNLVIWSEDGGRSWTAGHLAVAVSGLSGVSCLRSGWCMAVGQAAGHAVVLASDDSGRDWAAAAGPPGLAGIVSVSCVAAGECSVAGWLTGTQRPVVATSSGAGWLVRPALPAVAGLEVVSCVSVSVCFVAGFARARQGGGEEFPGAVEATGDGGRSWRLLHLPPAVGPVTALDCAAASSCTLGGASAVQAPHSAASAGAAVVTTDGGQTFSTTALPRQSGAIAGLACVEPGVCVATAASAPPSGNPGQTYKPDALILSLGS